MMEYQANLLTAHQSKDQLVKKKPALLNSLSSFSFPNLSLKDYLFSRSLNMHELLQIVIKTNHVLLINAYGKYTSNNIRNFSCKQHILVLEDADPSSPLLKLGVLPKFLNKEDGTEINSFIASHLSWGRILFQAPQLKSNLSLLFSNL